ncbi:MULTISPECIES: transcription factor FapR [Nosocomiicoccus]|uniref:transcription factor FapR n=1 Tax=Nosocomiicoccus TaxID=489909 RepID=UPI000836D03B|nr:MULTISPECIES: transcription factor FapR [Nosocomiicoccus]MDK6863103.1 transcription factor FapR [Nosocomiicoccus ampullae]OFL49678.1 hypothetical protein HMPREF2767_05785 [Nosocomiicoccus sp. HMSC067E10]
MAKLKKDERRLEIVRRLDEDPFLTDETLANDLNVSIQTIRLDRSVLNIPELRVRVQAVAKKNAEEIKSIPLQDVIGELVQIEVNKQASSFFTVEKEHAFLNYNIARGHFLFGQANSLAVAVLGKKKVLTKEANVKYLKPAKVGDKIVAKATVLKIKPYEALILVESYVKDETVFIGHYVMHFENEGEIE